MSKEQIYLTKRFGMALMALLGSLSLIQDFRDPRGYIAALIAGVGTFYNIQQPKPKQAKRRKQKEG